MAGIDRIFDFSLSLDAPALLGADFDVAGCVSFSPREASWSTGELTRAYDNDELDGDYAAGTPERIYAASYFSQTEAGKPRRFQILRGTVAPSQVWDVGVNGAAQNSKKYAFRLYGLDSNGDAFDHEIDYTSDASATVLEIVTGLADDVTAKAIPGVTAAVQASTLTRVTGAAGTWVTIQLEDADGVGYGPYNVTNNLLTLAVSAANPATAIATQLDACVLERPGFYGILNPYQGEAFSTAVAAWTEANKRLYLALDSVTATATSVLSGATDLAADIHGLAYLRTFVLHHHRPFQAADAAWFGARLPAIPGTESWAMSTLSGVTPTPLTTTHDSNIEARNANSYGFIGSAGNTWEGKVASGHYIDFIRFRDRVEARCNEAIYDLHKSMGARAKKVPGNDAGLLLARGALTEALDQMVRDGSLTSFSVSVPKQVDRSSADRAARLVTGVVIEAEASSAIHKYEATGVLTQ